jgi:hypothetical protein
VIISSEAGDRSLTEKEETAKTFLTHIYKNTVNGRDGV